MSDLSSPALYALAAKIATSYARANSVPVDVLPSVIQQAFQGLVSCTRPASTAPAPSKKTTGKVSRVNRRLKS